jgi:hypothetical protein
MSGSFAQGLRLLFDIVVIGGYLLVAFVFQAWILIIAPIVLALVIVLWAVISSKLEGN